MATSTLTFFYAFKENVAEKVHNLGSDTIKMYLTNVAPNVSTHTAYDGVTGTTGPAEIAAGNGYTATGNTCAVSTSAQTAGTYKLVLSSPTAWTGSGAGMATFRYAVLYNSTSAGKELIGYYDYGTTVTLGVGDTFTPTLDGSAGVLTLA